MTKIIASPINLYKGQEKPTLHFRSINECAEIWNFPVSRIIEAIKTGVPIKGYCIDEELDQ